MLAREVCGDEASLCLTWSVQFLDGLSLCALEQIENKCNKKSSAPTGGILPQLTTELRWVHSSQVFLWCSSFTQKALFLAGMSGLCGYTQMVVSTSHSLEAYPTTYLHCKNQFLSHLSRDWPLPNVHFLPFAPGSFLTLWLKLQIPPSVSSHNMAPTSSLLCSLAIPLLLPWI